MTDTPTTQLRSVIIGALVCCLAFAMAPWMSGGQAPLAMLMSACALLLGSLLVWRQPAVRQLRRGPLVVSYAALLGFGALSLLWTVNRYSTALWLVGWLMAGVAFVLAYTIAGEAKGRRWLARAYLVSVGIFCVGAIWIYLTGEYERLTGSFYWANPAAAYLIPSVFICLASLRYKRGKKAIAWAVGLAIILACFWLTDSRGAGLVLLLLGGLYLVWGRKPKAFWITFVFSLSLAVALVFGLILVNKMVMQSGAKSIPGTRFGDAISGSSQSASDRWQYLRSAGAMWLDRPWGGVGAGAYGDVHPKYQTTVTSASANAHSLYAQTFAELGIIGGLLLLWLLVWLLIGVLRGATALGGEGAAIALGVLALVLHFGIDIGAKYPALLLLSAVLAGVVYRPWRQAEGRPGWKAPVMSVALLVPVISLYQSSVWAERAAVNQTDQLFDNAAQKYAEAHKGVVYDPDHLTGEGINLYTLAALGDEEFPLLTKLALERAKRAQQLDPYDGQHYQLEGRVHALTGDVPAAETAYRRALALDRFNHPDYTYGLALVLIRGGDRAGAIQAGQAMLDQYPMEVVGRRDNDPTLRPALANLAALIGNLHLQDGRFEQAQIASAQAMAYDATSLRARALERQVQTIPAK